MEVGERSGVLRFIYCQRRRGCLRWSRRYSATNKEGLMSVFSGKKYSGRPTALVVDGTRVMSCLLFVQQK